MNLNPFEPSGSKHKSGWLAAVAVVLITTLALSGCSSWLTGLLDGNSTVVPSATPTLNLGPAAETPSPTTEPVNPIQGAVTIPVWLPPQFNPEGDSPAGKVLKARLDAFMEANPGVLIAARVKASSGPGGLLESLTAASTAAPKSMPAVVVLMRPDLEAAVLKGLVLPLDGLTPTADDADWFPYARELGQVQNSTFGLPFAGDALVMVRREESGSPSAAATWPEIFAANKVVIFPVDDMQSLVTLALYRSAGGLVQDLQGRPILDAEFLQKVLQNYRDGIGRGTFPNFLTHLQTSGQAWQSFNEKQGDRVITWSSNYLSDLPPDAAVESLPSLGSEPFTFATGWSWALTDIDAQRRDTSIKLMEYLSDSQFLAELTAAAGYLPTRQSILAGWSRQDLQPVLNAIVLSAQSRPGNELLASLGPVLRDAVLAIFNGQSDPAQAAKSAAERLGQP